MAYAHVCLVPMGVNLQELNVANCELPNLVLELSSGLLQEEYEYVTSEPSLQALCLSFLFFYFSYNCYLKISFGYNFFGLALSIFSENTLR